MIYEVHNSTDDQLRFYRLEDCSFHPHLHKNLEVIFCYSGCVQVSISGRVCRLTAGQGVPKIRPVTELENYIED